MTKKLQKKIVWDLRTSAFGLIFFAIYYFYIWLRIDPSLIYQSQEPAFYTTMIFLKEFLDYPGGLTDYVSAFLSQFHYYPSLGALVVVAVIWLISLESRRFLASVTGHRQDGLAYLVPAVLLLMLHSQYQYPLSASVGLLVALVFYNRYVRLASRPALLRAGLFLSLAVVLYYLAADSFLLYALLCGLGEILINRSMPLGFFYLLVAAVGPYLAAAYLFIVSTQQAYFHLLPLEQFYRPVLVIPYALYLLYPLTIVGTTDTARGLYTAAMKKAAGWLSQVKVSPPGRLTYYLRGVILLLATCAAALFSFDRSAKTFLLVEYYARRGEWQQVLAEAEGHFSDHSLIAFHANRALYHTGRLSEDMFSFPQIFGVDGLLMSDESGGLFPMQKSDVLFNLGHINEAQHWAHEAQSIVGDTPWVLQRIVQVYILKDRPQVARNYLGILKKNLLFSGWAEEYLRYLDEGDPPAMYRELERLRSIMAVSDFLEDPDRPEAALESLLKDNKHNRMAFEYLMAYCLLTGELDRFYSNIKGLKDLGYPHLPRHYQEALLIYMMVTGRPDIDLYGWNLDPRTVQRFEDFSRILLRHGQNRAAARDELKKTHIDTYWFYNMFTAPFTIGAAG